MNYHIIPVTDLSQNCLLVWDQQKMNNAALIDPGGNKNTIIHNIEKLKLIPLQILLTHGHLDHVGAAADLAKYYQIPIRGPHIDDKFLLDNLPVQSQVFSLPKCLALTPHEWLEENQKIYIGNVVLKVLHCPGHTPGHIAFFNYTNRLLISGDIIFKGSVGRTDLPRGNHNHLLRSIKDKIIPLGKDVTFLPGHGQISTLNNEIKQNIFLQKMNNISTCS